MAAGFNIKGETTDHALDLIEFLFLHSAATAGYILNSNHRGLVLFSIWTFSLPHRLPFECLGSKGLFAFGWCEFRSCWCSSALKGHEDQLLAFNIG